MRYYCSVGYRLYQRTQSSINPYLMSKVRIVCHVSIYDVSRFILLASNANDKFHVLSYQYYFVLKTVILTMFLVKDGNHNIIVQCSLSGKV